MSSTPVEIAVTQNMTGSQVKGKTGMTSRNLMGFPTADSFFRIILYASAVFMLLLLGGIFMTLVVESIPSIKTNGFSFFILQTWDPVFKEYGALVFLVGTLVTSFLALAITIPFSLAIALFLGEYFKEGMFSSLLKSAIELLAGIPSVIYGFWALFVLVPLVRNIEIQLGVVAYGVGIMTASLILAVMIIPYSASIGSDVIGLVPSDLKEAALSLGATRYEMIKRVVLPYARSGICAGILLSLGRAIGETMAVTMVIGNSNILPKSIFSPSNTMASVIANEFTEATDTLYVSSLVEVGLLLLIVTLIINYFGSYIIKKMTVEH